MSELKVLLGVMWVGVLALRSRIEVSGLVGELVKARLVGTAKGFVLEQSAGRDALGKESWLPLDPEEVQPASFLKALAFAELRRTAPFKDAVAAFVEGLPKDRSLDLAVVAAALGVTEEQVASALDALSTERGQG